MVEEINKFSAPAPGFGLTQAPGEMPYEQPPQFTDLEEASEFLFDNLVKPKVAGRLIHLLKKGMPAEAFVNMIMQEGTQGGKFGPDLAMLLTPRMLATVVAIAQRGGLKPAKDFRILNEHELVEDVLGEIGEPEVTEEEVIEEAEEMEGFMAGAEEAPEEVTEEGFMV